MIRHEKCPHFSHYHKLNQSAMKLTLHFFFVAMGLLACQHTRQTPGSSNAGSSPQAQVVTTQGHPPGSRSAQEMVAAGYKRYGVEKGILYFRLDGAIKGTETIYFDHWGWREAKHINTKTQVGSFNEETNKVTYLDGENRYEYNPATHTANWFSSPQVAKAAEKYHTKDMTVVGIEMIKNMGGEKLRTEAFLGRECEVWELKQYRTTLWMWKGITVKERSKTDNIPVGRTCLIIDQEKPIPEEKITLPQKAILVKDG